MNFNNEEKSRGAEATGNLRTKLPPPRPMSQSGIHAGFRIESKPLGSRPSNFGEKKKFQVRPSDRAEKSPEEECKNDPENKPKIPEIVWKRHDKNISWRGYVVIAIIIIGLIFETFRLISSALQT